LGYLAFFLGSRVNELVLARLAKGGFPRLRESHGYLVQHLIESERSITELAERMEVTQQAASKVVAELARLGILELSPAPDRRSKQVRLSRQGWKAVRLGRRARQQIEKRLVTAISASNYDAAKATLLECLGAIGGFERIGSRRVRPPR
jgi:DNA-binding MarR family transcriptional regulator